MKFQFTLYCNSGKYKPLSTTLEIESETELKNNLSKYKKMAIQKICNQRYRDGASLLRSGYTLMKWRIYDPIERRKQAVLKTMEYMNKKD